MKCGNCHGADGNGAWLLAARAAADFAKLPQIIPDSLPDENKLCTNDCAKGTAAFSIKMQTGVVVEQWVSGGDWDTVARPGPIQE